MFISGRIAILLVITTQLGSVWPKKVPCGSYKDIAFLIDVSASLSKSEFDEQMSFVSKLIEKFDVGPTKTRVAAVTFSNRTTVQLTFKKGKYKNFVINKMMNIKHEYGGMTNTYDGLKEIRKKVFKASNGERPEYPDVLILLTDGNSHKQEETIREASKVKAKGIKIIAVGVGNVTEEKLKPLATPPLSKNFFYVDKFSDLENILDSVRRSTCDVTTTTTTTAAPLTTSPGEQKDRTKKTCQKKKADIVFIADMSSTIWIEDFKRQRQFLADLVDSFDINDGKTQVGMITFSDEAIVNFYLNTYHDKQQLQEAIKNVQQKNGITNTHLAFQKYLDEVLTLTHGFRAGVAQICIVLTDGKSREPENTIKMAEKLHKLGIIVFSIGVGNLTDENELEMIASKPPSKYMQLVNGYAALPVIKNDLAFKACNEPKDPSCSAQDSEIVFGLVGIGGSVRPLIHEIIVNIRQSFEDSKENIWFGIRDGCVSADSALSTDLYAVTSLVTDVSWWTVQSTIFNVRYTFNSRKSNKAAILFINTGASDLAFDVVMAELKELKRIANVAIVGIGNTFSAANLKQLNVATNNLINGDIPVFAWNGLDMPIFMKQLYKLICNNA